jgi:hypothetical protein
VNIAASATVNGITSVCIGPMPMLKGNFKLEHAYFCRLGILPAATETKLRRDSQPKRGGLISARLID